MRAAPSVTARCVCSARSSRPSAHSRARRCRARGLDRAARRRARAHRVRNQHGAARGGRRQNWMPTIMVVGVYLLTGTRRSRADRLVRRGRRPAHAGDHARPAQADLPAHAAAEPGVPRVATRPAGSSRARRAISTRSANCSTAGSTSSSPACSTASSRSSRSCSWTGSPASCWCVMGIPLCLLDALVLPRSQRAYRESRVISAKVIVQFVETMTGIRAVKAFRKEPRNDVAFGGRRGRVPRRQPAARCGCSARSSPGSWRSRRSRSALVVFWGGIRVGERGRSRSACCWRRCCTCATSSRRCRRSRCS